MADPVKDTTYLMTMLETLQDNPSAISPVIIAGVAKEAEQRIKELERELADIDEEYYGGKKSS